jgi:hypothetical protein
LDPLTLHLLQKPAHISRLDVYAGRRKRGPQLPRGVDHHVIAADTRIFVDTSNKRLRLRALYADAYCVLFTHHPRIANFNVVIPSSQVKACLPPHGNVVLATGVLMRRSVFHGGIEFAALVGVQSVRSFGGVLGTRRVFIECRIPERSVVVAGRVGDERAETGRGVVTTGRVAEERIYP